MRYQTLKSEVVNTFKKLGGRWVLKKSVQGIDLYKNNEGLSLYVFDNKSINGFREERFGIVIND